MKIREGTTHCYISAFELIKSKVNINYKNPGREHKSLYFSFWM